MWGEALALPLERVIGRKHAYVYTKPNDMAKHVANPKVRPTGATNFSRLMSSTHPSHPFHPDSSMSTSQIASFIKYLLVTTQVCLTQSRKERKERHKP